MHKQRYNVVQWLVFQYSIDAKRNFLLYYETKQKLWIYRKNKNAFRIRFLALKLFKARNSTKDKNAPHNKNSFLPSQRSV